MLVLNLVDTDILLIDRGQLLGPRVYLALLQPTDEQLITMEFFCC